MKTERKISLALAGVLACFLIVAFFVVPKESQTHPIVRLLAAVFTAAVAYVISGDIYVEVKGQLTSKTKYKIQATAGAAFFVLVFLFWNKLISASQESKPPGNPTQFQSGNGIQIGTITGNNNTVQQGLSGPEVAALLKTSFEGIEQAMGKLQQQLDLSEKSRKEDQKRYDDLLAAYVDLDRNVHDLENRGLAPQMSAEERRRFDDALALLVESGKKLSSWSIAKEISMVYRQVVDNNNDVFPDSIPDISEYVNDPFKLGLPLKEFLLFKGWAIEQLRLEGRIELPKEFAKMDQMERLKWIRQISPFVILEPKPHEAPGLETIIWFMKPEQSARTVNCGLGNGSMQQVSIGQIEKALSERGKTMSDALAGNI